MLNSHPILCFLFFVMFAQALNSFSAHANWAHTLEGLSSDTSDLSKTRSLLLRSVKDRFDLTYPYLGENSPQFSYGLQATLNHREVLGAQVNGQSFSLLGGRKFSQRLALEGRAGLLRQVAPAKNPVTVGETAVSVSGALFSFLGWEVDRFFAQLHAESSTAYTQLALPVRDDPSLRVTTVKATANFFPVKALPVMNRVRIVTRGAWSTLSDRNFRKQYGADALYGVMTDPIWLWLGIGAERMHNTLATGRYWAPKVFTQWGLRGEFSIPFTAFVPETFFSARVLRPLSLTFGGSLSRIKEAPFEVGSSNYSVTSLQWGNRNHPNVRLSYERIRSEQNGKEWRSDGWILAGQLIF